MKFTFSPRCAAFALAAVLAVPAFSASSALAADDKSTMSAVMELVGVSTDEGVGAIDYSERPKLVLPPNRSALPEPHATANRPGGWPAEMATERRRTADRYARLGNAPQEKKQGMLERALSFGQGSNAPVADEPSRAMLIEPPQAYRRPTKDLATVQDPDAKKGSWWNPLSRLTAAASGANASDETTIDPAHPDSRGVPARSTAYGVGGGGSAQQGGGDSSDGLLSRLRMPSFARGSDSD